MRRAAFALTVLASACAGGAAAQDRPPAYTNAEACLQANVSDAVAASSGASDAANFLLDFLCAEQVSYAAAYERNSAALAAMKTVMGSFDARSEAEADAGVVGAEETVYVEPISGELIMPEMDTTGMFESITVDPVTGALISTPGADAMMSGALAQSITMQATVLGFGTEGAPIFLRQQAGRLVLAHRRR